MPPGLGPGAGNPLVTQNNRTVVDNITSTATGAVNNLLNNAVGALGAVGSIASGITNALNSGGVNNIVSGVVMATKLDNLISGSSSFFGSGSPLRTTLNALGLRNQTAAAWQDPDSVINSEKQKSTGTTLTFPPDPAPYRMNFKFFEYERKTPLGDTKVNPVEAMISLPMPTGAGLYDSTTANWTATGLGMMGNALDNAANMRNLLDMVKSEGGKVVGNLASDVGLYAAATLGSSLGASEIVTAVESQVGMAPNPSLSQIFQGIGFRNFQFTWTFSPKSADESMLLKNIIHAFKRYHLPKFAGGTSSLIFNYPYICQPSFTLGQEYMTDFQYCVVKSVNVRYSPQGEVPAFYATTKAPVFVELSIFLEEMEYRLPQKYGGTNTGTSSFDNALKILPDSIRTKAEEFFTEPTPTPGPGGRGQRGA